MPETYDSWMAKASHTASSRSYQKREDQFTDVLQCYALLAIAESIGRLADAVEGSRST